MSDEDVFSHYIINTKSNMSLTRIKMLISKDRLCYILLSSTIRELRRYM